MTASTYPLGARPFGSDIGALARWRGAVELDAAFLAAAGEGWLRIFGPTTAGLWTARVAATATATAGISGPNLTDDLIESATAFTLTAGDAVFVARGPNHPDNPRTDASEPYNWEIGGAFDDFSAWFAAAGGAEVFLTISDEPPPVDPGGLSEQLVPLGSRPFGSDVDALTPWTGSVLLDSVYLAAGAEGWLRIFGPSGIVWTVQVASAADGDAGIAGPALTSELLLYATAFTLTAGDAVFVARGPNHPDNLFSDPSEPYTYNLGEAFNDFPTWFAAAGAADVVLTISDGQIHEVVGDALPVAWSVAVPGATGVLTPLGDALPVAWSVAVPGATGVLTPISTGDALPVAWTVAVPGATGVLTPLGDALPVAWSVAVPGATGVLTPLGDALPVAWTVAVPGATGVLTPLGDALPVAWTVAVPGASGVFRPIGDALPVAWTVAVPGATGVLTPLGDALPVAWTVAVPGASGQGLPAPGLPTPLVAWGVRYTATGEMYWSGDEDLDIGGDVWEPMVAINVEHAKSELGAPSRRARVQLAVTDPQLRSALLQDPGPLGIEVSWFTSDDRGISWSVVPTRFVGRLSAPEISGATYSMDVETYSGDVDRGRPVKWSHERQMTRDGSVDRGMEMAARLSVGFETKWPP